jgi:Na+-transporting methylmalonyl-CoA/oxaloacetate decarboxylase beta subunit
MVTQNTCQSALNTILRSIMKMLNNEEQWMIVMKQLRSVANSEKINPLIGSAGVSAVPMAARVSQKVGQQANPKNFLLMHAMGPNVAGVIGTATAAGLFLSILR